MNLKKWITLILIILMVLILFNTLNNSGRHNKAKVGKGGFSAADYIAGYRKAVSFELSGKLNEISGLATSSDGRLFAHNDEQGTLFELSTTDGKILKSFRLGKKKIEKDFEGLAVAEEWFYLITSSGNLYRFREGADGERVEYKKINTKLNANNDVEGLCYDPQRSKLLIACKGSAGKKYKGKRAVFAFDPKKKDLDKKPLFLFDIKEIVDYNDSGFLDRIGNLMELEDNLAFAPSGIERHPVTGHFFIIAARGNLLVEVDANGILIDRVRLDPKMHRQPEGIAFTRNNDLVISDEGGDGRARLTIYPAPENVLQEPEFEK